MHIHTFRSKHGIRMNNICWSSSLRRLCWQSQKHNAIIEAKLCSLHIFWMSFCLGVNVFVLCQHRKTVDAWCALSYRMPYKNHNDHSLILNRSGGMCQTPWCFSVCSNISCKCWAHACTRSPTHQPIDVWLLCFRSQSITRNETHKTKKKKKKRKKKTKTTSDRKRNRWKPVIQRRVWP